MGPSQMTRKWIGALVVSLLLHAAVGVWLRDRPTRPVSAPPARPIEWTFVERPAAPAVPTAEEEVEKAPPSAPTRKRAPPTAPTPTPRPSAAPERPRERDRPVEREATTTAAPEVETKPPLDDAPTASAHAPRLVLDPTPLPPPDSATATSAAPSDFAVRDDPRQGLRAPDVPGDVVQHIANETLGKAKVTRGLVHPYYAQLGRKLLETWDAERAVQRKGLRGYGEQVAERSRVWTGIWMERAAQFGSSGNPLDTSPEGLPREVERTLPSIDPNLAARQKLKKQMRQEFRSTRKALLRVVQAADGRLLRVDLISPSNDPAVDREALVDVRTAAAQLPPPPDEVRGSRTELVSLWQFELIVTIQPPVPSISFEFDEVLGYVDPKLPLDRRIYKRVRLVSVE